MKVQRKDVWEQVSVGGVVVILVAIVALFVANVAATILHAQGLH